MIGDEHAEVAAQEDERRNHHHPAKETEPCRDIHGETVQRATRAVRDGAAVEPRPKALKGGLPQMLQGDATAPSSP